MRQLTRALSEAREGAGQVRDALLSASFRPRLPGLTKIVSKLSKEGSWRKALEVYEVVDELGLRPDTALTNSAISACDKGGRWQKAMEIFDRMEPLGLHRDAITYSATISALAKGKQWHAALQIFDHMQLHGVEADVVTCCSLINALERGGQWQLAEKLFLEMCTVQEEQEQLAALARAAPNVPPGLGLATTVPSLARSHTSPSSVLLSLRSGSAGNHGGLPSVDEAGAANHSELDLTLSLSAQQGILDALVQDAGNKGASQKKEDIQHGISKVVTNTQTATAAVPVGIPSSTSLHDDGADLATAFARVTSLSTASPSGSVDPGFDRALSSTLGGSGQHSNPFAAVAGIREHTPPPPPGLTRATSAASSDAASVYSYNALLADSELNGSFGGMSAAAAPFVSLGSGGGGGSGNFYSGNQRHHSSLPPHPPSSRLQRGTFGREPPPNGPVQAAAAAHLRRAMSCFPDFDDAESDSTTRGGIADGTGFISQKNLTAMFNFSHATRVSPNRVCCNALLAAYARAKPPQWQRALRLLEAMWSGPPTLLPDVVSYNTALKACANAFQLSKGLEIYHEMRRNGVYPNATSYNCLIDAASDASNKEVMQEVGGWLTTAPTEVQAACMNAYVTGLVKVGLWNEALIHFHEMLTPRAPAHPTSATFCTIMAGHMSTGDYPAVQLTFDYMCASGVSPNIVAFNTLLAALAAMGSWTQALDVLNAALAAAVEGVHANTATFNTVLSALYKGSIAPNAVSQYPFLASQAVQVYQQMQAVRGGAAPDSTTFNTLIAILDATKHSTQVVAVYNLMAGAGMTPDGTAGHKVLSAAISTGQIAKAVPLAQALQMQNISIEPQQLSTLLAACVNAGAWDLASQLCSAAHSAQGAAVAAAMFNFVLRTALDKGQFSIAMELIGIMQSMGVEVEESTASSIIQGGGDALARAGSGSGGGGGGGAGDASSALAEERGINATTNTSDVSTFAPRKLSIDSQGNAYPHQQHATVVFQADNIHNNSSDNGGGAGGGGERSQNTTAVAVPRTTSTDNSLSAGLSMQQFPITPQISSSPGANLSPESPLRSRFLAAASGASGGGGVEHQNSFHVHRSDSDAEGYASIGNIISKYSQYNTSTITDATATITTTKNNSNNNNKISLAPAVGHFQPEQLSLIDTNAMLASMELTGDAFGCIEVFSNMKVVGIMPDRESYHHVIATLVNAGDGAAAVEMCRKGHEGGGVKHVAQLVDKVISSVVTTSKEESVDKVVDLRGCGGEVAVTVAVFWLMELERKKNEKSSSFIGNGNNNNAHVSFVFGPLENKGQKEESKKVDWHAVRAEVQRVLTSGHSSMFPALSGLAPRTIASNAITFAVKGPCAILEVQPSTTATWSSPAGGSGSEFDLI